VSEQAATTIDREASGLSAHARRLIADPSAVTAAVAALTVAALALRLAGAFGQDLFGDEMILYHVVHGRSLADALDVMARTEKTPPLGFILDWLTGHLGAGATSTRIPSVVLGTATVPVVYALGRRLLGRRQGLLGAGFAALSPFAVFYGVENRSYAMAAFFVVASTLALLLALDRAQPRWWWVVYAAAVAAAVYSHYTAAFPLAAQTAWAAWSHRDRIRGLAIASAAAALAFVPWLWGFSHQLEISADEARRIEATSPTTLHNLLSAEAKSLVGHPVLALSQVPGRVALAVLAASLLAAVGAVTFRFLRGDPRRSPAVSARSGIVLLAILALAAPLGVVLYGIRPDTSLLLPRNLFVSAPYAWLLAGALIVASGRRVAPVCATVALGAMLAGSLVSLDDAHRRPAYSEAASYIRSHLRPGDTVANLSLGYDHGALALYMAPVHVIDALQKRKAFALTRPGSSIWAVVPLGAVPIPSAVGPRNSFRRVSQHTITGFGDIGVIRYVRRDGARAGP